MKVTCKCGNALKILRVHHNIGDDLRVVVGVCPSCISESKEEAMSVVTGSDVKRLANLYSLDQLVRFWREAVAEEKQVYKDAMKLKLLMEIVESLLD